MRKNKLIDAKLVNNNDLSSQMSNLNAMLLRRILILKLENPPRFSFAFKFGAFLNIVIEKLFFTSIGIESIRIKLLF